MDVCCNVEHIASLIVKSEQYEKNRVAINSYKFWRHDQLPPFAELPIVCFRLDKKRYVYLDKESGCTGSTIEIENTNEITCPFFQCLENPLLVEDEYNVYHYEYLYDNVRRSEDYGADNHVYMLYHDINSFICFLCVEDIVPYLKDEKFIFLFGNVDQESYPIDFTSEYGINYQTCNCKPVQVEEICRLIVQWQSPGYSGGTFLAQVCDFHPNLLTVPGTAMSEFDFMYKDVLKGKNVLTAFNSLMSHSASYIQKEVRQLFNEHGKGRPSMKAVFDIIASFYEPDYVPSRKEWFVSIYLAYAMALRRNLNHRIVPAIFFWTHPISRGVRICQYYDIFREFKYLYGIEIIRRPSISLASRLDTQLCHPELSNNYKKMMNDFVSRLGNFLGGLKTDDAAAVGSCFSDKNHEFLSSRRLVRFEDLKLHPKATLMSMVCFFDLPYADILMHTTENGIEVGYTLRGAGSTVKGYNLAPVHNLHENGLSKFDHFRLEVLMGDLYSPYGYKPLFFDGKEIYSKEDIMRMFDIKFKFEKHFNLVDPSEVTKENRRILINLVERALSSSLGKAFNGREYVPIPLIKPMAELLIDEMNN